MIDSKSEHRQGKASEDSHRCLLTAQQVPGTELCFLFTFPSSLWNVFLLLNNWSVSFQDSDNLWWDAFATEFFEDDATLTLSFCLEDGPKRYSKNVSTSHSLSLCLEQNHRGLWRVAQGWQPDNNFSTGDNALVSCQGIVTGSSPRCGQRVPSGIRACGHLRV